MDARAFAIRAHGDQKYGDLPYSAHLDDVADVVSRMEVPEGQSPWSFRAAAYLHDVLEDTETTRWRLSNAFGPQVADLVHAVTDEPGPNRKARKAATYPKIRAFGTAAVALKLADRIANVRRCVEAGGGLLEMYRKEQREFRAALFREGELTEAWAELEDLLGGKRGSS